MAHERGQSRPAVSRWLDALVFKGSAFAWIAVVIYDVLNAAKQNIQLVVVNFKDHVIWLADAALMVSGPPDISR